MVIRVLPALRVALEAPAHLAFKELLAQLVGLDPREQLVILVHRVQQEMLAAKVALDWQALLDLVVFLVQLGPREHQGHKV